MNFEPADGSPSAWSRFAAAAFWLCLSSVLTIASSHRCLAQDVEPRRWSHLPIDTNYVGAGYGYTEAQISDRPALQLENVQLSLSTWAATYIRTFELLERTARIDLTQPYQSGEWTGLLAGAPASAERNGWADTIARFSINVVGAPPLAGREFAAYRAGHDAETIVGIALAVQLPTGQYFEERLVNLGTNRFTFRPQIGVVHSRGSWSFELTGTASIFTDNDEFFGGSKVELAPHYLLQSHIVYTFRSGLWVGVGSAYAYGAQSTVNRVEKDDRKESVLWGVSAGYPIFRDWALKLAYIGSRRLSSSGNDTDSILFGASHFF